MLSCCLQHYVTANVLFFVEKKVETLRRVNPNFKSSC